MNFGIVVSCNQCKQLSHVTTERNLPELGYVYCPCCGSKLTIVEDRIDDPLANDG